MVWILRFLPHNKLLSISVSLSPLNADLEEDSHMIQPYVSSISESLQTPKIKPFGLYFKDSNQL